MMKNVIKLIFLLFDLVIGCCVLLHAQVRRIFLAEKYRDALSWQL